MAKLIAISAIALFSLCFVDAVDQRPPDAPFASINDPPCAFGDVWAEQKIKMECVKDGVRPVACLPNAAMDGVEVAPGATWTNPSFKFQCIKSQDELLLSFDVIACLLPNGDELAIGNQTGVANKGIYKCVKNAEGSIARKYQAGCFFTNGRLYTPGQSWIFDNSQIVCAANSGVYDATATGCVVDGGQVVHLGGYHEMNSEYYKCQVDGEIPWKAEFNKVGDAEYHEWLQSNAGEEEEAADGDIGSASGFIRPTTPEPTTAFEETTEPPTEPPTEPATEPPTTTVPPTTTACPTYPAPTTQAETTPGQAATTPSPNQCQDLHPICKDLCSLRCEGPTTPAPKPVATTPKPKPGNNNNQQQGGRPCTTCNQGKPQKLDWNLLIINDKPSRPGHWGRNKRDNKRGRNNKWEDNLLNGAYWYNLGNQGGKWKDKSSSSSSEENQGKPHKHHGHGHFHHSHSKEDPRPQPQPQPQPQQPNGQCVDLASSAIDVVKVMCPKSCGLCTPQQPMNKPTEQALKELVTSWSNNVCRAINPLSKPIRS
jgi:hypothetical protein